MALQKDGSIRVGASELIKGIASSPYLGIAEMVNIDIHSKPGVARIAHLLEKETSTTVTDLVRYMQRDPGSSEVYAVDASATVYERSGAGSWSTIAGSGAGSDNGLAVWKDYLFVVGVDGSANQDLDVYGPLSGSESWTLGWEDIYTGESATHSPSFVSIGDALYFGIGRYLTAVEEVSGQDFDPSDSGTYTVSQGVLVLPENYTIETLDQIGGNLVIGTSYNGDTADIIVWNPNKSGTDAADADLRIPAGDDGVNQIKVFNNLVYSTIGTNAQIKVSDLTKVQQIKTINDLTDEPDIATDLYPSAISVFNDGVLFGVGKILTSANTQPNVWFYKTNAEGTGVWTSFTISAGTPADGVAIGAIVSLNTNTYLVSWEDTTNSTYGVDVVNTSKRYTDYAAYFSTQLYQVGSDLRSKNYQNIGFRLAKPLAADQGIRIKYRESLNDSFTTLKTYDFATYGAISSYEDKSGLPSKLERIQFRVELTTGDPTDETPELLEFYVV